MTPGQEFVWACWATAVTVAARLARRDWQDPGADRLTTALMAVAFGAALAVAAGLLLWWTL